MSQPSVKAFAQAILKRPGGLHILVNNAGLGYCKKSFTEEGVGMLTQVCGCQAGYLLDLTVTKCVIQPAAALCGSEYLTWHQSVSLLVCA
jgi:NAD(P)-dependent dehydrogenase (short-subunit alcohol dehydrogenase family)